VVNTKKRASAGGKAPWKNHKKLAREEKQVEEDLLRVPKLIVSVLPWFDPAKVQVAMANAVEKAGIEWPHNCLRHSFCSHAVALHGFTWTSLQADHSERVLRDHYREVVTKFEADAYFAIHA
jgi:hypothetical protein